MNPADWAYFTGGDGSNSANWSPEISKAAPIVKLPAQCGSGPVTYVPALGTYLMVAWYNPQKLPSWFDPAEMKYDFYQSPHPWGPWTFVSSYSDRILTGRHMYGPSICAKFQERQGSDVRVTLFTSGCPFEDNPTGIYKMWEIPLLLKTRRIPIKTLMNDSDPQVVYTGTWTHSENRHWFDYGDDVHSTQIVGDSAQLTFTGTGIDYISERNADHGPVDVYIDGMFKQTVDLSNVNFPRLARVVVFQARGLRRGTHTIKIVNKTTAYAIIDAFAILP